MAIALTPKRSSSIPTHAEVFFPPNFSRQACERPGPTDGVAPLGYLLKPRQARTLGDISALRHSHDLIIYELHVKGFTANPNSGVSQAPSRNLCRPR